MPNFFTENTDLLFQFEHLNLQEVVGIMEKDYTENKLFDYAPRDYNDALDNFRKVLEIVGDLTANYIAPRAAEVDESGSILENGQVSYARGTRESLEKMAQAELMGFTLPRKYGGLNFPHTVYMMAIEMVSRADAALMNIFGLQDIAETIHKFGTPEQMEEFLPGFASGKYTGAMALTEPDAGSDLQAVKLHAYQDEQGQWYLRGVKRFITNGNGNVLLVLARSEAGTKDGRGLSLYICYGDETVKIRRIENKLGIHGSPTCELQFNDTPAQLIGKRKFGLIKYVLDLMNGARLGVSAQALGISQAAYEAAVSYARAREQFGKPIYQIPAVTNMLIDMRVKLESNRSLLYATAKWVDLKDKLEGEITRLKEQGKSFEQENERFKKASKIAALLTPITKFILTESANQIAYDSLQIHGGAGYMKEFTIERLARDARITNIYEGTSQLQIVAATGGVLNDLLGDDFAEKERKNYKGNLSGLANHLKDIRQIFLESLRFVLEKNDMHFQEVAARELVELYSYLYIGYL
ncbi:MAG: acyl-CoA dehydrogenase family protein, partial [Calditrichaeota bacterium]|nr:acyl-CoA dehydrogenase family protein [Calditrichota bacterium]